MYFVGGNETNDKRKTFNELLNGKIHHKSNDIENRISKSSGLRLKIRIFYWKNIFNGSLLNGCGSCNVTSCQLIRKINGIKENYANGKLIGKIPFLLFHMRL